MVPGLGPVGPMGSGSGFSTPSRNQRAQNGATPGQAQLIWAQSGAILSTLISLNLGTPGYGPRFRFFDA